MTTETVPPGKSTPSALIAVGAAALWGVLFAVVHVHWLVGGRALLPDGLAVTENIPLLVIDVLAIPFSLAASALALALIRPPARRFAGLLRPGTWALAAVLAVHAAPSVPDWLMLLLGRREAADLPLLERFAATTYEPWFLLGGVLFAPAAHTTRRVGGGVTARRGR
ncbi:DUF3995 domain-containing protein [Kitasatospora sp. NPDC096147]|uniref:DUF3995 domain-containing protein n=1 Tax=Kitasatospora sp. NPDC096147 TaxID=3364093 RepID=UPI0037F84C83